MGNANTLTRLGRHIFDLQGVNAAFPDILTYFLNDIFLLFIHNRHHIMIIS